MSIRCSAKALIIHEGAILLNRCRHADGSIYYDLPGGGQHLWESMAEAVRREVLEETGYTVDIHRPCAFSEEIYTDLSLRSIYLDYTHRICHIFLATLSSEMSQSPTVPDNFMEKSEWISIEKIQALPEICPPGLSSALPELLRTNHILFLGTHYNDSTEA